MPVPPPRRPGSQIAPGQRPYNSDAPTAGTHNKRPIHELTAGRTYRVRDKDWTAVWAEDLLWEEANMLKERLVAERRSTTARVEDMTVPPPDWYVRPEDQAPDPAVATAAPAYEGTEEMAGVLAAQLAAEIADMVAANPVTDDGARDVLQQWIAQRIYDAISADASPAPDRQMHPDPYLAQVQETARAAVRPLAQAANQRPPAPWPTPKPRVRVVDVPVATRPPRAPAPPSAPRAIPRDKTVVVTQPRSAPPPRDKTVASEIIRRAAPPDAGEAEPMMSPLKAAMMPDEFDLPDGATVLGEDDLSDLLSGVGGGPSDEDHARAKVQAEKDRLEREAAKTNAKPTPAGGTPEVL